MTDVLLPLASTLGLGSVLGYLIAGIVIGPILALLHIEVNAIGISQNSAS